MRPLAADDARLRPFEPAEGAAPSASRMLTPG
jgi:hypothetical protein